MGSRTRSEVVQLQVPFEGGAAGWIVRGCRGAGERKGGRLWASFPEGGGRIQREQVERRSCRGQSLPARAGARPRVLGLQLCFTWSPYSSSFVS